MRLQKFLADAGVASRRHAESMIRAGMVAVNGTVVREQGVQVTEEDEITVRGNPVYVSNARKIYIAFNKPVGVVSSCSHRGKKVVTDFVRVKERVFPIGRLDEDSCGLILLTNDGPLHHLLSHPSFNEEKEYHVRTKLPLNEADLRKLSAGVPVLGKKTRKATVYRTAANGFGIILKEGRNRQIRRMVETVGNEVVFLERQRVGHIQLGNLKPGEWRYLTDAERLALPNQEENSSIPESEKTNPPFKKEEYKQKNPEMFDPMEGLPVLKKRGSTFKHPKDSK